MRPGHTGAIGTPARAQKTGHDMFNWEGELLGFAKQEDWQEIKIVIWLTDIL